jgi:hypothetical protein
MTAQVTFQQWSAKTLVASDRITAIAQMVMLSIQMSAVVNRLSFAGLIP